MGGFYAPLHYMHDVVKHADVWR